MIVVAAGPRAVEQALLDHLDDLLSSGTADTLLRLPLRIIVPSQSLRLHLSAAIVRRRGRGVAGVVVQTLFAAAIETLERGAEPFTLNDSLFKVLVQQLAAREPSLHDAFGDLSDGYASVSATVADLLDAGFTELHADPLLEVLSSTEHEGGGRARAQALVRVAGQSLSAFDKWNVTRASTLLQRARDMFAIDPDRSLPARALLVHGFADATGVAADFIEELVRHQDARVYLDHPLDPAQLDRVDPGIAFTERLRSRFGSMTVSNPPLPSDPATSITLLRAPGTQAEVRAMANRLRTLLDGGARPEDIGVVARELAPYAAPLRTHLTRLGIPFSGLAACGPMDGLGRRVGAALDLLEHGERAPIERWLDATTRVGAYGLGAMQRADLRVALRAHGAARVGDAAQLNAEQTLSGRAALLLPVRRGLRSADSPDGEPVATRRTLDSQIWRAAIAAARRVLRAWRQWPQETSLRAHAQWVRELLAEELGWQENAEPLASLARLLESLPLDFTLKRDEFLALLKQVGSGIGLPPLGGAGAGVQVLSVVEARARTWQHLFLLGMNRDVFPRIIREDPLLPDRLRRALATVLPDLPIKEAGYDEERYLFAQVLSASGAVTLSWQFIDDDGKPRVASTLVERLLAARAELQAETVPSLYASDQGARGWGLGVRGEQSSSSVTQQIAFPFAMPRPGSPPRKPLTPNPEPVIPIPNLRPAHEHAVLAGLYANRAVFAQVLPLAMAELTLPDVDVAALVQARLAILGELDPDPQSDEGHSSRLGPYFGFIGAVRTAADQRRRRLYVTTIERVARCPWQTFLLRLLGLEQTPDPLASLPGVSPLMVGSTVHKVLEDITNGALGGRETDLAAVVAREGLVVPWPPESAIEALLQAAAVHVLREEGIGLPGFAHVLVERARPYLKTAQEFEWGAHAPSVLAAEVEGHVTLAGETAVWFRADRVDRAADGLRLTDYKTGKPFSDRKRESTRREKLLGKVRSAEALQGAAYALSARAHGGGEGRYLFLKPDIEDYTREAVLPAADAQIATAFKDAVATVLDAWHAGSFFPRLVEAEKDKEPMSCDFCEVSTACLRGDSASRRRLREWGASAGVAELDPAERALLSVWRLGMKESEKADEE